MSVTKGKIKVGSTFFGLFLPFKFPLLPGGYAVYVDGKKHPISKLWVPFVEEPLKQLAGHEVELVISRNVILAMRPIEDARIRLPIILCYVPAIDMLLDHDFLKNTRAVMFKTLLEQNIIPVEGAAIAEVEQWQLQVQEKG